MKVTLQCAYCGNEDVKISMNAVAKKIDTFSLKCKCGKWLVRNGIMGHQNNV